MNHSVFYFRGLIVKYSVYLRGPALFPCQQLIPGDTKAILHHKLVLQLYCPQGNNLRNQQSPSAATDAPPPSINKTE